jgi:hypothetical protein
MIKEYLYIQFSFDAVSQELDEFIYTVDGVIRLG